MTQRKQKVILRFSRNNSTTNSNISNTLVDSLPKGTTVEFAICAYARDIPQYGAICPAGRRNLYHIADEFHCEAMKRRHHAGAVFRFREAKNQQGFFSKLLRAVRSGSGASASLSARSIRLARKSSCSAGKFSMRYFRFACCVSLMEKCRGTKCKNLPFSPKVEYCST